MLDTKELAPVPGVVEPALALAKAGLPVIVLEELCGDATSDAAGVTVPDGRAESALFAVCDTPMDGEALDAALELAEALAPKAMLVSPLASERFSDAPAVIRSI